ncbi:MAG: T9SS type A sorting domain-containing protein, partial [Bacteroidota bacterium]
GDYTVQVTVTHGACTKTATKDITIAWVVGKEEIEMKETGFRLYPNPTTNTMFVEIISDELGVISEKLQIIDINGALVYQTAIDNNQLTIQIEDLAKGVYFVKIGEQTERFVKE